MTKTDVNKISDASGNSIMNPIEERDHVKKTSQFNLTALLWVIVTIAIIGGLITNISKIMDAVWLIKTENAKSITIPHLSVKLHNKGNESISLPLRGQCLLWPPEHSWDYECGYEFKQTDTTNINSDAISIPAKGERDFLIHVTKLAPIHQTKTSLARFFSTGEWHIQFIMFTDQNGRNIINTGRIPFTVEAMSKGYVFEVFRKPLRRKSLI